MDVRALEPRAPLAVALFVSIWPLACADEGDRPPTGADGGDDQGGPGTPPGDGADAPDGAVTPGDGENGADLPRFAAVGYGGRRAVSYDGTEWVHEQFDVVGGGDDNDLLRGVTHAEGRFIAVGGSSIGRFMWTTDGSEWGEDIDQDGWLGGVAYGDGVYVAVGGNGRRAVSENGEDWETVATDYSHAFRAAAFGGGVFVAVGDSGRRMRSADGRSWTHGVTGGSNLSSVAYGNGYFVAVGFSGRRVRSADGITWDHDVSGGESRRVIFAEGEFLAVGGTTAYTSSDGAEWTTHTLNRPLELIAYADGIYVGANWSPSGTTLLRSVDGLEWEVVASGGNGLAAMAGASR